MQFVRQFPTDELRDLAVAEWSERLCNLTPEEIGHGLRVWQGKWPPNAQEFLEAAKGGSEHRTMAYKKFPKSLPRPKADPAVVLREIEAMRKCLKKVHKNT